MFLLSRINPKYSEIMNREVTGSTPVGATSESPCISGAFDLSIFFTDEAL